MRHRSPVWIALARNGRFHFETKVRIGSTEYTAISAPRVDRAVMTAPLSVGNCTSATLNLSLLTEDNIVSSTPIVILGRLTDGVSNSEWLEFGTFYINQRDTSHNGLITVSCYDAMLKANQPYLDGNNVGNWPKTMKAVVEEIAYRIGVSVDPRTQINVGADYTVPIPVNLTMIQVLGYIGACHGGNWIITEENALRLVPLSSAPVAYSNTSETPGSTIPQTYYITDENDLSIGTSEDHNLVWAVNGSADPADGLTNVTAVLGRLTSGAAVTVTGIVMSDNKGNSYTAGTKDGSVITIDGNPYVNQNICDALYEKYNGLVYEPYTASKTVYDPATELGDQIIIGDKVHSVLCTAKMVMDLGFRSDISAPNSEALSEEYPYLTEKKKSEISAKQIQQQIESVRASIPTKVSTLANDSDYQTESGVVSIIEGKVTADYIEARGVSAKSLTIKNSSGRILFNASGTSVNIGNFTVARNSSKSYIYSGKTSYSDSNSGVYIGTDGIGLGAGKFYVTSEGSLYAANAQIAGEILSGKSITFKADYATYDTDGEELAETVYSATMGGNGITLETDSAISRLSDGGFYTVPSADGVMHQMSFGFSDEDVVNHEHTVTGIWVGQTIDSLKNGWKLDVADAQLLLRVRDYTVFSAYVYNYQPGGTVYGTLDLGAPGMEVYPLGYWYFNEATFTGSDKNIKNTISDIDKAYSTLFDNLRPVSYKYNAGTSGRLHIGFIAQEVEESVKTAGLSSLDFAGYAIHTRKDKYGSETTQYYLRYEEFIALNTYEIQRLKKRVSDLEKLLNI